MAQQTRLDQIRAMPAEERLAALKTYIEEGEARLKEARDLRNATLAQATGTPANLASLSGVSASLVRTVRSYSTGGTQ